MWRVEPREGAAYAAAAATYLAAVIAFLLLQEVGLRLRRAEQRQWWAGTGRDLLNAAGLCAISGAFRLLGFPWPAALVVGGTLTLVLFGASVFVATQTRTAHPRAWALAAGLAVAVAVLVWDHAVVRGFAVAVELLFDRGGGSR